jgi:hypothetical protein
MTSTANLIVPSHNAIRRLQPAIAFVLRSHPFNYGLGSGYDQEGERTEHVESVIDPNRPYHGLPLLENL